MEAVSLFHSVKVRNLLQEFYSQNFSKASVNAQIALDIVGLVWKEQISFDRLDNYSELRQKVRELYNLTKNQTATEVTERDPRFILDFTNDKSFLDFGANKLDTVNKLAVYFPNLDKVVAVDVISQASKFKIPQKSEYYQIKEDLSDFELAYKVDTINIQFVLHHLKSIDHIRNVLAKLSSLLTQNGRIILWEETFENKIDNLDELVTNNTKVSINTDFKLTKQFYELNEAERFEFIIVNDWIINTFNSHMQWTLQYHSWEEWVRLFKESGLKLEKKYNLGLRVNGNLKQGVHIIGEFRK